MKFEEVLPKMRDERRVGVVGTTFFKISADGKLWMKLDTGYWHFHPNLNENYLTTDEWSLEPRKVKRWQWVFGIGDKINHTSPDRKTELEASIYMSENWFEWAERIDHTMIEEES